MRSRRSSVALSLFVVAGVALALSPSEAAADGPPCNAWDVEYVLAANLTLTETPMGEGNGTYAIGPGRTVLRFDDRGGQLGGEVKMLQYRMREAFTIKSKTLFWTTTVVTDTTTLATPTACSSAAEGALDAQTVRWRTPVRGYRTDGTLTCDGSLCGKFGAPPPGQSPLHIGPNAVQFSPFVYSPDLKTFRMATTHVSKTDMPKQSAAITLAGRETKRTCVYVAPCK